MSRKRSITELLSAIEQDRTNLREKRQIDKAVAELKEREIDSQLDYLEYLTNFVSEIENTNPSELIKENEVLKRELAQLKVDTDKKIEELTKSSDTHYSSLFKAKSRIEDLLEIKEKLEGKVKNLNEVISQRNDEVNQQLEANRAVSAAAISDLEIRIKELKDRRKGELQCWEADLSAKDEIINSHRKYSDNLQKELDKVRLELVLCGDHSKIATDLTPLDELANVICSDDNFNLTLNNHSLQKERTKLLSEKSVLEADLSAQRKIIENFKSINSDLMKEIDKLKNKPREQEESSPHLKPYIPRRQKKPRNCAEDLV